MFSFRFFIDRPIFAAVLSILLMIVGTVAYTTLPVEQYPDAAPPTVIVTAQYPGASADVVADTVAAPLETAINGVEGMRYLYSQSTDDGRTTITVTFRTGVDLDQAQVLVQNRVAQAEPRLPEEVRRFGVTVEQNSAALMMVINLVSPDGSRDPLYISNYATLQIREELLRLEGVGGATVFGGRDFAMRIWLDPDRMATLGVTTGDVLAALRRQNVQVAGGTLGEEPTTLPNAFQVNVRALGRLAEPDQFGEIVVRSGGDSGIVRVRDFARIELGAQDYSLNAYLSEAPSVAIGIFQRPGSNALATAERVIDRLDALAADYPTGLEHRIVYNPTQFIEKSIQKVGETILEAVLLVILVVILFLQTWRAAIIPIIAIPVSLVGTFAVMAGLGYSLNTLSLFGLVLAIGIVVDDAIVVVENVERRIREGVAPKEAAKLTMDEVGGALVAIGLVLAAVFVPSAFLSGITGEFYRQFAITIAVATLISVFVSLTLSPALAAILLKPHDDLHQEPPAWRRPIDGFFAWFNRLFDRASDRYGALTGKLVRRGAMMGAVYAVLIGCTVGAFMLTPQGFVPQQAKNYFIVAMQLPPGASLARTDAVVREATVQLLDIKGVDATAGFAGLSGATFTLAPNAAALFVVTDSFEDLARQGISEDEIYGEIWGRMSQIQDAFIIALPPPPVDGIGNAGGFRLMIQDRAGLGADALNAAVTDFITAANGSGRIAGAFTFYETSTPHVFMDIDRTKAEQLGVSTGDLFQTLEVFLGSSYVNDFTLFGRNYQVTAQADAPFRADIENIAQLQTRNNAGNMVPLGALATFENRTGPARVPRYNLYPAAEVDAQTIPGVSQGQTLDYLETLAEETLPPGIGFEWTELALEQRDAGNTGIIVFALAIVFVFLVLAALYESWFLPLAVILIVPMCLLAALVGINLRGMPNDILVQIGLIVLVGLACKNAILIVEFARQLEREGHDRWTAATEAARLRLRPILMTSLAFTLGVVPLVIASGAAAELRQALGTAVFAGMIGVTLFGLFFTPVFYVACRRFEDALLRRKPAGPASADISPS